MENILTGAEPLGDIYQGIFAMKRAKLNVLFFIVGKAQRLISNLDILEKWSPTRGF